MWRLSQRREIIPGRLLPEMTQCDDRHEALAEALRFQEPRSRTVHAGQTRQLIQSDYFIFAKQRLMEIIPVKQKVQDIAGTDGRNRLRAVGQTLYEQRSPRGVELIATPKLES